ncbi:phage antirepressor Ant [Lactobacillus sp. ESL0236]|uniref:antA/AntB antirepressor family protein n=1 Tax=unclassified Lactobacillus TaxID=2620435 RepID=UPI000EFC41D2|nr:MULTISPECIES: antA/AntB antirepressor family protein [unclassified Lactobacillus]RMC36011.1 phage antirepressor Ant [Lactobacillus sp. ESL0237]RMC42488.1 phage antirepressor Ant [Lactobacillus sp. ESL0234]RMC43503.1 phage antirepressor Ant [Lactobacillus sp. ESL0236]
MQELIKTTIDSSGKIAVSGRELHKFLEIETPYTKWFTRMCGYGFAEKTDFIKVGQKCPIANGGFQVKNDHAMTLDMAKEISMIQRNDKGKQARQYFIQVEKQYKQDQLDMQELSPELQMFSQMLKVNAEHERKIKRLDQKVDNITEIVSLNTTEWRKTAQGLIHKMAKTEGGFGAYQQIQGNIYKEVDARAGSSLKTRLTNLRQRMALNGSCKSAIDRLNRLDVIDADKRLKQIYMAVVKDFAIKYKVWEKEY